MRSHLENRVKIKISLLILFLSITFSILMFRGSIDDFAPKHLAIIYDMFKTGSFPDGSNLSGIPFFYVLGVEIISITGLSPEAIIFAPIQLLPYIASLFFLLYVISNNLILSSLAVFLDVISGVNGTLRIDFWPHGIGYILFFLIIAIIILLSKPNAVKRSERLAIIFILGISLIYSSYDPSAELFIFIPVLSIIVFLYNKNMFKIFVAEQIYPRFSKSLAAILLLLIVVELGLSHSLFIFSYLPCRTREISKFLE